MSDPVIRVSASEALLEELHQALEALRRSRSRRDVAQPTALKELALQVSAARTRGGFALDASRGNAPG